MVNRMGRGVGSVEKFSGQGRIITDLPDVPVDNGAVLNSVAASFASLSSELGALADAAAKKEGLAEGHEAGMTASLPPSEKINGGSAPVPSVVRVDAGGDRGAQARDYYIKLGYTPAQAAGIVGNLIQESGLRTEPVGDNGTAFGIAQWRGERFERLKQFASGRGKPHGDYETQLAFVDHELRNHEKDAFASLQSAKNVDEATAAMIGYERPAGWTRANPRAGHGWGNRIGHARRLLEVGGSSSPSAVEAPQPVKMDTPLALRKGGGVKNDAYNAAAVQAFGWRLDAQLSADIQSAYDAHKENPAEFDKQISKIYQGYSAQAGGDPQLKASFDKNFTEKSTIARTKVSSNAQNKLDAERKSEAGNALAAQRQDLERQSYMIGANPDGDTMLARYLERAERSVDAAYGTGAISLSERDKYKADARKTILTSRIEGTFDALPDADAKRKFADGLVEGWARGEGVLGSMSKEEIDEISGTLRGRATNAVKDAAVETKMLRETVSRQVNDDLASVAATGQRLVVDGRPLDEDVVRAALGEEATAKWLTARSHSQRIYASTADMAVMSEAEIAARVNGLAPQAGQEGFAEAQAFQIAAAKEAERIIKARRDDPAAAVDAAFPSVKAAREGLDFSQPETFRHLVEERVKAQTSLGIAENEQYPLTRSEAQGLAKAMDAGPDVAASWAVTLTRMGKSGERALGQLAKDAPGLAVAADWVAKGADPSALRLLARQRAAEKIDGYKAIPRKMNEENALSAAVVGSAFQFLPGHAVAVRENAWKIFQALGRERGVSLQLGQGDSDALYQEALNLAAGASAKANGAQVGGIAVVNGTPTLVPVDMEGAKIEGLLHSLRDDDLKYLPPIQSQTGYPVTARQLRGARLIAVRDGIYRVAQNDPSSGNPKYVMGENGYWELDLRALDSRISGSGRFGTRGFMIDFMGSYGFQAGE